MATSSEKSSGQARYASYPSLVDRVVLITGGASGIGASFVEHFVAQGARVGFLDIDTNAGTALAKSLGNARHKPLFVACDVTDIPALHAAIAEVRAAFGPIEVLVNNAANDRRHALADVTPESFDAGVAVNVRHQLFAAQAVVEDMKAARAGSIINLGSHCWMLKSSQFPVYAMSKAAVPPRVRILVAPLESVNPGGDDEKANWQNTDKHSRTERLRGCCRRRARRWKTLRVRLA